MNVPIGISMPYADARREWEETLSRIQVQGGDAHQRIKFYTDLWHVLLGRHKLDDVSGDYPDRTGQEFIIRTLLKTQRENQNFICTTRMLSG